MAETAASGSVESRVGGIHTFLIADVRGYTRFTVERGDAAAAQLARKFAAIANDVIGRHEGSVIELRGDEALAVFTSARQALRAATGLQARVAEESLAEPELAMRIGIGLDAGEAIPVDGGFRGAALNLAARLCSLAGAGEVLASDTVISLARRLDGLEYLERGMVPLKGFSDPVRVMQVVEEAARVEEPAAALHMPLPIGGFLGALPAGPLVARDAELERVLDLLDAVAGGSGRLIMLAGEPGAGKTRLAQEVTMAARNRDFVVATGTCYEARQSVPYYPFLDALAGLYGAASSGLRSSGALKWPHLSRLLPEAGIGPAGMDVDGQHEQERLFRAVAAFVQAMAEDRPVALFLDDLHWADGSSLELLRHLAKHTRGHAVLILGTYRDVEVGRQHPLEHALLDLTREGLLERVPIRRLDHDGTSALIAAIFGQQEISDEFADLVYQHTEGNPFFTQEVLRAMVERGDVFQSGTNWDRRSIDEIEVPESVRSVIGRRLSRLPETAQETMREASVLGPAFGFDDLAAMSELSEAEIERSLEEAEGAGLIRDLGRDRYSFNHALTQQSLYAELSSRRRRRLHLAAGEAIESLPERKRKDRTGELAWHFLEGDDSERALRYSLAAGNEAREVFAWSEAERHFRTALELAEELEDRQGTAESNFKLGETLQVSGDHEGALPFLDKAADLYASLGDVLAQGRALQLATFACVQTNRMERRDPLLAQVEALIDAVAQLDPSVEQVAFFTHNANTYWGRGRLGASEDMGNRAAEAVRALGNETLLVRVEMDQAERRATSGHIRDALVVAESMIPRAEALGDMEAIYAAYSTAAELSMVSGRLKDSLAYRKRDLEAASLMGRAFESTFALVNLAQVTFYLGDWQASWEYAQRALDQAEALVLGFATRAARMNLGQLAAARGEWEEARQLLEHAVQDQSGPLHMGRYSGSGLARLEIKEGYASSAIARLERLIAETDPADADMGVMLPVLALALAISGDGKRGEEVARDALTHNAENALACVEAWPALGVALARQGRHEEAAEAFRTGRDLAHSMAYPYAEATVLAWWGREEHSRERLEEALEIFRRLGARKDVEEVEGLLAGGE